MGQTRIFTLLYRSVIAGALGGAANAWHFYATELDRPWTVVPAGAVHGAVLALLAVLSSALAFDRKPLMRLTTCVITGWVGGFISTALMVCLSNDSRWNLALVAPGTWANVEIVYWPFKLFGMVPALACLCWSCQRRLLTPVLRSHVLYAVTASVCGSLIFWWQPRQIYWHYCIPHGICWGTVVGFAVWTVYRKRAPG